GGGGADADAAGQPGEPAVGGPVDAGGHAGLGQQHAHEDEHGQHGVGPGGDRVEGGGGQDVRHRRHAGESVDADEAGHSQGEGHGHGHEHQQDHHRHAPQTGHGARGAGEEPAQAHGQEHEAHDQSGPARRAAVAGGQEGSGGQGGGLLGVGDGV